MNPRLQPHIFVPRLTSLWPPHSPHTSTYPRGEVNLQSRIHDNLQSSCSSVRHTYRYIRYSHHRRGFTTSNSRLQKQLPDHYATLSVPPTASSSEIKKSFYSLSKLHHPDRTRSTLPPEEAEASNAKYLAISEAYAILGDQTKREKYDRDRAEVYGTSGASGGRGWGATVGGTASGFGSSAHGQAGGRKASGLSRRRSQFRGPPPSFYKSGGWGASASKRQRAHDSSTGTGEDTRPSSNKSSGNDTEDERNNGNNGDRDPDGNPWPFRSDPNDVPHFDRRAHFRRQNTLSEQLSAGRKKRRKLWEDAMRAAGRPVPEEDEVERERQRIMAIQPSDNKAFLMVSGVLAVGFAGGVVWALGMR